MRVLDIDPGSLRLGWGVVDRAGPGLALVELGVVRPSASWPLARRLAHLHAELLGILQSYGPERIAIESVFHGVNTRALVTLGQARGVALAAAGTSAAGVLELSPAEVKKAVTGNGQATKAQVAHMVGVLLGPAARERLSVQGTLRDATDALAVAIAATHRSALPAQRAGRARGLKSSSRGLFGKGGGGFYARKPRNLG
jgi:crossover junction endodeoxyribonuclease RuvC